MLLVNAAANTVTVSVIVAGHAGATMKTESNKQIAERIAAEKFAGYDERTRIRMRADAIEAALDARHERAAKIARDKWMEMSALDSVESEHYARAGREIAAAIANNKCPHGIYRHLTSCALCDTAIRGKD